MPKMDDSKLKGIPADEPSLLEKVRRAQVTAGEQAVIEHLKEIEGNPADQRVGVTPSTEPQNPDEDELWRASLRAEMRPVALRHGRKLFVLCASIGVFSGGLERMVQAGQQTGTALMNLHARKAAEGMGKAIGAAHAQLVAGVNGLVELSVLLGGWKQAEIIECQTDIKRAAELVMAEPGKTASGIILPMH